jgi:DNA modification methylase
LKKTQNVKEILGENRIICGDVMKCLEDMSDDSVDLIITSPPYFKQRKYTDDILEIGQEPGIGLYLQMLLGVFNECKRVVKPTGSIIWNMGDAYQDKTLLLLPYRLAISIMDHYKDVKLINDITWVKTNPTPRQYKKRLISSTEPFFHFVKSDNYTYNPDAYLEEEKDRPRKKITCKKGDKYREDIKSSNLTDLEQTAANVALLLAIIDVEEGKITDFRMKIRGIHKKAFGGQAGGRNNQIDNNGFTVIRMYGKKLKRDVLITPVANSKNIDHPAIFPLKVIKELVLLLSDEDAIVLDPFCGSGTTCLAAKELGRKYLGIELSEKYCDVIKERLK